MRGHTQTHRPEGVYMLYNGFFRTEVSKRGPGGLVSCRVQLQPLSNTPETANLSILETFRQVFWGKLELNSAGHLTSRTAFGHPALEQVTNSRMGTCWFFFLHLCFLLFVIFSIGSPECACYTIIKMLKMWSCTSAYVTLVKLPNLK